MSSSEIKSLLSKLRDNGKEPDIDANELEEKPPSKKVWIEGSNDEETLETAIHEE